MAKKPEQNEQVQSNPQVAELQQALQALQEQNKQLLSQAEEAKSEKARQTRELELKAKEKEKQELENDSDLASLLKGLQEPVEEKKSARSVDNLSNEELVGVISEGVEKFVDAKLKLDKEEREKSQDGFLKKLGNVENMLGHMVAMQSVNDLRSKYPDFNNYKEEITQYIQETPGLSIEKAYKLAKAERLEKEPALNTVDTELPNIGPSGLPAIPEHANKGENRQNNTSNVSGMASFRGFLSEGIGRALANRHKNS